MGLGEGKRRGTGLQETRPTMGSKELRVSYKLNELVIIIVIAAIVTGAEIIIMITQMGLYGRF
jgi:hypothetical protein